MTKGVFFLERETVTWTKAELKQLKQAVEFGALNFTWGWVDLESVELREKMVADERCWFPLAVDYLEQLRDRWREYERKAREFVQFLSTPDGQRVYPGKEMAKQHMGFAREYQKKADSYAKIAAKLLKAGSFPKGLLP